jgi:hypothetical protein
VRPAALLVAASLALAAHPAAARAQNPAVITGKVTSDIERPLEDAEIRVAGLDRSVRSTASGVYTLDSLPSGQYLVQVRRLGFAPVYFSATLKPGEKREIDVELKQLPQKLAEVKIRERSGWGPRDEGRLAEFDRRRRSTAVSARFLTRDDLINRHRGEASLYGALRTEWPFTGCNSISAPRPMSGIEQLRASGAGVRTCRLAVSVDGAPPMSAELAVDYPLRLIEAIEIYRGGVGIPIEFEGTVTRHADVIVVIWTGVDSDW